MCSEHEVKDALKNTIDEMSLEVLEALKCCTENGEGCETCPFANYKCTCRHDLMFAARQLLHKQSAYIAELERVVGGYAADQEIWLTRNTALEKEIEELKEQKAYYWEKADTLAEDYRQLKRDAEVTEINLGEALQTITQLTKSNEELWNSYHQGYSTGYEYGKQDALSADRAEPSKERPEVEG
jgi:chromosome segregation ATPase